MIDIVRYSVDGGTLWIVEDNTIDNSREINISRVYDLSEMKKLVDNLTYALWKMCTDDSDELTEYVKEKVEELLDDIKG